MKSNLGARAMTSLSTYTALCAGEELFYRQSHSHVVAAGLSGILASLCSFPFGLTSDYIQAHATVDHGKLHYQKMREIIQQLKIMWQKEPERVRRELHNALRVQLPVRMVTTCLIFELVTAGTELLKSPKLGIMNTRNLSFFKAAPTKQEQPSSSLFKAMNVF